MGGCFIAGLESEGRGLQAKEGSSAKKEHIFSITASSRMQSEGHSLNFFLLDL